MQVGDRAQRYRLFRRGGAKRTVVVDFGGPGLSVLSGASNLASYVNTPGQLEAYNLLFLEEPWVTRDLTPECDSALTSFYQALRSEPKSASARGSQVRQSCLSATGGRWGFDADSYSQALAVIRTKENIDLEGFLGYSFGSVRYAYAHNLRFRWVVLVHPYPLGVGGSDMVAARTAAVKDLQRRAGGLPVQTDDARIPRSLPVTEFDRLSALVELSYLGDAALAQFGREVVDGESSDRIGALSDSLWQRYGTESISPGYVAYLDEVCRVTAGWPSIREVAQPGDVVAASTVPCGGVQVREPSFGDEQPRTCVLVSEGDSVVPKALTERFLAGHAGWRRVVTSTPGHDSAEGLGACLSAVGG